MKKLGILITHGTDTMAWTHAFLRYSIKNNSTNIVVTGSQIPLPALGDFSDAYINLGNSIRFISNMKGPNIITVFNYGTDAFSDSLHKINRWDNNAFTGDLVAKMEWDTIKHHDKNIELCTPTKIDNLYIITTGGTIESIFNDEGVLVPSENHLMGFIAQKFSPFFYQLSQKPAFSIDSSDLTFDRMKIIAQKVVECINENDKDEISYADLSFAENVKIIYTDPFKKTHDYIREVKKSEGYIIAGYGGGNITIDHRTEQNLLPLIKKTIKDNRPVILSSQVPLGPADFIYSNAWEAIKSGAISGVDLSLPEIQVRLSYLLGHKEEILLAAKKTKKSYLFTLEWLFISGMKFRTKKSKLMYEKLKKMSVYVEDILVKTSFNEALEKYIDNNL